MAKVSHFRYALRFLFIILGLLISVIAGAQTLGGKAVYNFLKLPFNAPAAAAGGMNLSHFSNDVGSAMQNPALLHQSLEGQLAMHFTALAAGIKGANLSSAFHHQKWNTTFGGHIFFLHYGNMAQTDAAGNSLGQFTGYDYVAQATAAKTYLERWQYGGALKWIQSFYGPYHSSAIAIDIGLLYKDTANGLSAGMAAKNMGMQLKAFQTEKEELPFDLQLGITKKLLKAPLAFSVTAHHLHRFSILYNDTSFNTQNNFNTTPTTFKKLFSHFILATHVSIGKHLEATIGYNMLRRQELTVGSAGNGLTGFSAGLSATFQKMQFHYARSAYQKGIGTNQIGFSINLKQIAGVGSF